MKAVKIKENIYWVGAIDWKLRNFHGYLTQRGSTYNAYLIIDEKITLVDTVKAPFCAEMLSRISSVIDPKKIDYVISNHVEMDHSGALPELLKVAKNAVVYTSPNGERGLNRHYDITSEMRTVKTGDTLSLGKYNLEFNLAQMVHWPDNMVSFLKEEKILFSNDAFGQHIATSERFTDEYDRGIVFEEAAKYYANIVLSYGTQVTKLLKEASQWPIEIIAPSHGLIYRDKLGDILNAYTKWAANECSEKAVILYGTMWGSTEKMAYVLRDLFEENGIRFELHNLDNHHISDVMTSLLDAKYICIGSPTLNNNILPSVAAFLTYMKGLAPKNRTGIAFASYGWSGESVKQIEDVLDAAKFELPVRGLRIQYTPNIEDLNNFKNNVSQALFQKDPEPVFDVSLLSN